jgi:hypothetical protein
MDHRAGFGRRSADPGGTRRLDRFVEHPGPMSERRRLSPVVQPEAAVRPLEMALHGLDVEIQAIGDLLVRQTLGTQHDDLALTFGEPILLSRPPLFALDPRRDGHHSGG